MSYTHTYAINIALTMEYIGIANDTPGSPILYTGNPSANTEAAFNNLVITDPRPFAQALVWQDILDNNDPAHLNQINESVIGNELQDHGDLQTAKTAITNLETAAAGLAAQVAAVQDVMVLSYHGSELREAPTEFTDTQSTTSGVATFSLTDAEGDALFTNVDYMKAEVSDNTNSFNFSYSLSVDKKTLSVTAKKAVAVTVLGISVLAAPVNAANGTSVSILVKGN